MAEKLCDAMHAPVWFRGTVAALDGSQPHTTRCRDWLMASQLSHKTCCASGGLSTTGFEQEGENT